MRLKTLPRILLHTLQLQDLRTKPIVSILGMRRRRRLSSVIDTLPVRYLALARKRIHEATEPILEIEKRLTAYISLGKDNIPIPVVPRPEAQYPWIE